MEYIKRIIVVVNVCFKIYFTNVRLIINFMKWKKYLSVFNKILIIASETLRATVVTIVNILHSTRSVINLCLHKLTQLLRSGLEGTFFFTDTLYILGNFGPSAINLFWLNKTFILGSQFLQPGKLFQLQHFVFISIIEIARYCKVFYEKTTSLYQKIIF